MAHGHQLGESKSSFLQLTVGGRPGSRELSVMPVNPNSRLNKRTEARNTRITTQDKSLSTTPKIIKLSRHPEVKRQNRIMRGIFITLMAVFIFALGLFWADSSLFSGRRRLSTSYATSQTRFRSFGCYVDVKMFKTSLVGRCCIATKETLWIYRNRADKQKIIRCKRLRKEINRGKYNLLNRLGLKNDCRWAYHTGKTEKYWDDLGKVQAIKMAAGSNDRLKIELESVSDRIIHLNECYDGLKEACEWINNQDANVTVDGGVLQKLYYNATFGLQARVEVHENDRTLFSGTHATLRTQDMLPEDIVGLVESFLEGPDEKPPYQARIVDRCFPSGKTPYYTVQPIGRPSIWLKIRTPQNEGFIHIAFDGRRNPPVSLARLRDGLVGLVAASPAPALPRILLRGLIVVMGRRNARRLSVPESEVFFGLE